MGERIAATRWLMASQDGGDPSGPVQRRQWSALAEVVRERWRRGYKRSRTELRKRQQVQTGGSTHG